MSAGYLELFIEQGDSFTADITLDSINGSPFNLSNYSIKSDIRKSHWSANTTISFNSSIAGNGTTGIVTLTLDAANTQLLTASKYVYDVFLTNNSNNDRSKVLEGIIYVDPSVTKI